MSKLLTCFYLNFVLWYMCRRCYIFDNKYPYLDFHELNLDWVIAKITEFDKKLDEYEDTVLAKAKEYTDSAIQESYSSLVTEFNEFKNEVTTLISDLDSRYDEFVDTVNNRMTITDANVAAISRKVDLVLDEANAYTNQAIINNNEYIIDQTTKALETVTVLNYFTGARVSIQAMFDYLAQFHLQNAISVNTLVARSKTVNDLIAYNMTMTQLATNGATIITN